MMQQPPSSLPNFTMPPPGFPNFSSTDNTGPSPGGNQASDSMQELWVETKAGDGKVLDLLLNSYKVFTQFSKRPALARVF